MLGKERGGTRQLVAPNSFLGMPVKLLVFFLFLLEVSFASATTYAEIARLAQSAQNLNEFVTQLPDELRLNFTLIYKSRSPHGGLGNPQDSVVGYDFPRVLLFTKDGRVLIAFTGNPEKKGYGEVEVMHFNDQTASFALSKFIIGESSPENGKLNPAECLRCHGQDPRPFSDSYPLWPGFYGSVRDTFPKEAPETPFYKKFLKEKKTNPKWIYSKLLWDKTSPVPPYLDPKRFDKNAVVGNLLDMKYEPNTRLGMALTELNRKRIQRKLKASPHYEKLKYGLLSGLLGCEAFPTNSSRKAALQAALERENASRVRRLGFTPQGPFGKDLNMLEFYFIDNLVEIDYLSQALKIDRRDWTLAFENGSLAFFDGILSSEVKEGSFYLKEDFIHEIMSDISKRDSEIAPYFSSYHAYKDFDQPYSHRLELPLALKACDLLKEKHAKLESPLPQISDVESSKHSEKMDSENVLRSLGLKEAPFTSCVRCHEGTESDNVSREIPFSNPKALRQRLREKAASSERPLIEEIQLRIQMKGNGSMPPNGHPLSIEETQSLRKYLDYIILSQ